MLWIRRAIDQVDPELPPSKARMSRTAPVSSSTGPPPAPSIAGGRYEPGAGGA